MNAAADPNRNLSALAPFGSERGRALPVFCRIAGVFAALFALWAVLANANVVIGEGKALLTFALALTFCACALCLARFSGGISAVPACILILGVLLRFAFALAVDAAPISDYALFYDGAQAVLSGNLSYFDNYYFTLYPNLIPICYYYAGLFAISNTLLFARLVSAVLLSGTLILVYLLAREIAPAGAASAVAFLYAFYPASVIMGSQLTNQTSALFCFLLGLYLLLRRPSVLRAAACGALLALGNLLRSEAIVLYAGLLVLALLLALDTALQKDRARIKRIIWTFAALFLSAFLTGALLSGLFSKVSRHRVSNESSFAWKFVVGLNDAESGTYNGNYVEEFMATGNAKAIIARHIETQTDWIDFFRRKERVQWGDYEYDGLSLSGLDPTKPIAIGPLETDLNGLVRRGQIIDKALYTGLLLLFFAGTIAFAVQKRAFAPPQALLILIFDAYFCAYLLIEVSPRYRYFIIPFLLLIALNALSAAGRKKCEKKSTSNGRPRAF